MHSGKNCTIICNLSIFLVLFYYMTDRSTNPYDLFPEKETNIFEKLFTLITNFFAGNEISGAGYHHAILHRRREKLKIAGKHKKPGPTQLAVDHGVLKNVQIGNQTVSVYSNPNIGSMHNDNRQIKSGF